MTSLKRCVRQRLHPPQSHVLSVYWGAWWNLLHMPPRGVNIHIKQKTATSSRTSATQHDVHYIKLTGAFGLSGSQQKFLPVHRMPKEIDIEAAPLSLDHSVRSLIKAKHLHQREADLFCSSEMRLRKGHPSPWGNQTHNLWYKNTLTQCVKHSLI